jgi:hypothetical protein
VSDYCPAHDPILIAGYTRCNTCGQAAYPSDAEWLDDDHILAAYPPGCGHLRESAWVVTIGAERTPDEWCKAIARSTGELCRNRARPDTGGYCHSHNPVRWGGGR